MIYFCFYGPFVVALGACGHLLSQWKRKKYVSLLNGPSGAERASNFYASQRHLKHFIDSAILSISKFLKYVPSYISKTEIFGK